MSAALAELFKHNLWANMRLLDACADLTEGQLGASVPGTYGSIRDTLTHILGAEERYIARLTGQQPPSSLRESEGFPGLDECRAHAQKSGEALIELARSVRPTKVLRGTWRSEPYALPVMIVLTQAINHATEHRAHINTILTQQGVEPPDLDAWAYNEDKSRG